MYNFTATASYCLFLEIHTYREANKNEELFVTSTRGQHLYQVLVKIVTCPLPVTRQSTSTLGWSSWSMSLYRKSHSSGSLISLSASGPLFISAVSCSKAFYMTMSEPKPDAPCRRIVRRYSRHGMMLMSYTLCRLQYNQIFIHIIWWKRLLKW